MVFGLAICIALPLTPAVVEDATTKAIRKVMEDNYAASDAEHLPRLTKTMSRETPNPERFVNETIEEWVAADTSTRLVDNGVLDRETAHFFRTAGQPREDRDMANRNFPRRSWSSAVSMSPI